MSVLLIGSSFATTLLIPPEAFQPGGAASGRALAYLAHEHLGELFGTVYDLSTIAILWFAGASAMAGLLNLVPRYLPRYGMAPEWTQAPRGRWSLLFTAITFLITVLFKADVDAQGGAYATGVLVLMTSAAVAVTLLGARRAAPAGSASALITLIFVYTTITNVIERPDGVKIASWFIVTIIVTSLVSRVLRSTELRVQAVEPDETALRFIREAASTPVRIIANRPDTGLAGGVRAQAARGAATRTTCRRTSACCSSRCGPATRRSSAATLRRAAASTSAAITCCAASARRFPNAIAALLLYIRDETRQDPARLLRLDRRKSDRVPAEVPGVRRRRYGAGHPRSAAPDRAGPAAPAPDPRRVSGSALRPSRHGEHSPRTRSASSTPWPVTRVTSN